MASIKIPPSLRPFARDQAQITVSGATVGEAINDLLTQCPDLNSYLIKDGELRKFVNIFIGEENIHFLDGLETPLEPDSNLRIIPSIAGGRG